MKAIGRCFFCFLFLSGFLACGGGGSGVLSIAGTWVGQLFQASSVICADGPLGGVGFGVPTDILRLEVRGEGRDGAELEAQDGACVYRGVFMREKRIELFGDDASCRRRLELRFLDESTLEVFFPAQTPAPGTCTIAEDGLLEKLETRS